MKIMWQDILLVLGILSYLGTSVATNIMLSRVAGIEGYAEVATNIESNPVMRKLFDYKYYATVTQWLGISLLVGVYWAMRYSWFKYRKDVTYAMISVYVIALLMMFAHNMLNDVSIVIGTM